MFKTITKEDVIFALEYRRYQSIIDTRFYSSSKNKKVWVRGDKIIELDINGIVGDCAIGSISNYNTYLVGYDGVLKWLKEGVIMPRVIKEAPVKEKQIVCEHYGRTIAYVKNDIKEYHGRDISGGPDGQEWIVCPGDNCHKQIILKSW